MAERDDTRAALAEWRSHCRVGFAAFLFSMAVSLANRFTRVYGEVDMIRRDPRWIHPTG